jgi:hypothetical protein
MAPVYRAVWARTFETVHIYGDFSPEDGNSVFLRNVGIYLQVYLPFFAQKTNTDIITAVRTWNLKFAVRNQYLELLVLDLLAFSVLYLVKNSRALGK